MNKRERTHQWEDPNQGAEMAKSLMGLEYLTNLYQEKIAAPPILSTLGFSILQVEYGAVTFKFEPQEFHYNPIGSVHGGVISTLLDSAMGCTLHSKLAAGVGYATLELKVNFLKPITIETGSMIAKSKIIHSGSRTALLEATLVDENGRLYAHAVSTCMILK